MYGYARSAKPQAAAPATPERSSAPGITLRPAAAAHRFERFALVGGEAAHEPLQRMSFARFAGMSSFTYWTTSYDPAEAELIAAEKRMRALITSTAKELGGAYSGAQQQVNTQFTEIANATIDKPQYRATSNKLANLERTLYGLQILKVIDYLVTRLPDSMRSDDNEAAIIETLASGAHTRQEVLDVGSEYAVTFAKSRLNNVIDALNEVLRRLAIDRPDKVVAKVALTGSDLHNRGRQVVIVTYGSGEKEVYKPRSVGPDRALVGRGAESGFGYLNTLSDRLNLPTMGLTEVGAGKFARGYAEFKTKVPVLSTSEVRAYYHQLGQVAVAAKLFGANDLHLDNVMVTEGGAAAIIDAETSFLPFVMAAKSFGATALPNALREFTAGSKLGNNAFLTREEVDEYGEEAYRAAKVDEIRFDDLRGRKKYLPNFEYGIVEMRVTLLDHREEIVNHLWSFLGRTTRARYVPIDTTEFRGIVREYQQGLAKKRPEWTTGALDRTMNLLEQELLKDQFEFMPGRRERLRAGLAADLKAGDIPVFSFSPKDNRLRFHGLEIADSILLRAGRDFVFETVERITFTETEQIVQDLLGG
ncbi:MAG: DUF4135 domain-containing protein [Candidatus Eremiobacteraeota bacterium]|nr:DUF4135 domain-containing protein [Candidatus Eremiobacteraeota bacterium]